MLQFGSECPERPLTVIADVLKKKKIHVQFNEYTVSSLVTLQTLDSWLSLHIHMLNGQRKKLINNKTLFEYMTV